MWRCRRPGPIRSTGATMLRAPARRGGGGRRRRSGARRPGSARRPWRDGGRAARAHGRAGRDAKFELQPALPPRDLVRRDPVCRRRGGTSQHVMTRCARGVPRRAAAAPLRARRCCPSSRRRQSSRGRAARTPRRARAGHACARPGPPGRPHPRARRTRWRSGRWEARRWTPRRGNVPAQAQARAAATAAARTSLLRTTAPTWATVADATRAPRSAALAASQPLT